MPVTRLKAVIYSVAGPKPSEESVREFVSVCRKIARAQLLVRKKGGRSYQESFGLDVDDLAMDSIAELFQRNGDGVYVQLQSYFESVDLPNASEQALFAHTRRLVCSRVNNAIMALHGEHDPSFWKILRNCKLAIQTLQTFRVLERFGDVYIVPANGDPMSHLPFLDQNDLERVLWLVSGPNDNIPTLLSRLSRHLQEQREYCRMVRLFSVASAIKTVYIRKNETVVQNSGDENHFTAEELIAILHNACCEVRQRMMAQYVERKGVDDSIYGKYFAAIKKHLTDKYISNGGYRRSLFEYLTEFQPDLTKEVYRERHRPQIEYLLRITENEALLKMKKEFV